MIIRTIHLDSPSAPSNLVPSRFIGTAFSRSLAASPVAPTKLVFSTLRSLHAMGSEPSKAASIYDFTVKVCDFRALGVWFNASVTLSLDS